LTWEKALYDVLVESLCAQVPRIQGCARALAKLDVLCAFAEHADKPDYWLPELTEAPGILIEAGWHPVVEHELEVPIVPNDLLLDENRRMLIITGSNMGGKSTYRRPVALIILMAHVRLCTGQAGHYSSYRSHLYTRRRGR